MSKAIDDLKHEHEAILTALAILENMNARMVSEKSIAKEDLEHFIGFLKEFADKCHHGKEEGLLFPALIKAGIPEKDGPIGVLLSEHRQGRELIKAMEKAVSDQVDYGRFVESARAYSALLLSHIQKENQVLFPAAEKVLTETQLNGLYDAFEEYEEKVIGAGRHEVLHALLKELKERYPGQ